MSEITINLICPSLSNVTATTTQLVDQKIDLGSISRAFGLDPSTLRLNGHFISRGVDLVSSSVTWKSLLSFFSSKGFSTGIHHRHPLLVTGKLSKLPNKRGHDSQDFHNGIGNVMKGENAGSSGGIQMKPINLLKNKKLRESNSEGEILNGQSCRRKHLLEDVNLFKKLKINEDKSVSSLKWLNLPFSSVCKCLNNNTFNGLFTDIRDKVDHLSGRIPRNQITCSNASKNLKRVREGEAIVAATYKRIR